MENKIILFMLKYDCLWAEILACKCIITNNFCFSKCTHSTETHDLHV